MAGEGFDISITSTEVCVKQDGSLQSGVSRGVTGVGFILLAAYFFARVTGPGHSRGPGMLHQLMNSPRPSFNFTFALIFVSVAAVISGFLVLNGVRLFFPAGEQLQCDRTTFTYSKIPWISLRGRWKRRSFPVSNVSELIYGVIVEGNEEKTVPDTYGLCFYVGDKEYKIFGGLEAPDADDILKKLRAFGVDVIVNQDMSAMIANTPQKQDSIFGNS